MDRNWYITVDDLIVTNNNYVLTHVEMLLAEFYISWHRYCKSNGCFTLGEYTPKLKSCVVDVYKVIDEDGKEWIEMKQSDDQVILVDKKEKDTKQIYYARAYGYTCNTL